jgi:hypothetical protein
MANYDEDLENLENWLRRLKIEYDIFFNGNRKRPPDDLKVRVEKLASRLSEASDMTSSQRFRYTTLLTRFYVYRDLWRRTMMDKEGTPAFARKASARRLSEPAPVPAVPPGSTSVSISTGRGAGGEIRVLFDALSALTARQPNGSLKLTFEKFSEFISARTQDIQSKYQCQSVRFSLCLENDGIRFTAAPEV